MPQFPHSKYTTGQSTGAFVRAQGSHSPSIEVDAGDLAAVIPEFVHPFKVTKVSIAEVSSTTVLTFRLFEGHVFGTDVPGSLEIQPAAWTVGAETRCLVEDGGSITKIPGSSTLDDDYLDNRNVGMQYSVVLDTLHPNVLYVKIERDGTDPTKFVQKIRFNTSIIDAQDEATYGGRESSYVTGSDELETENLWHGGIAQPTNPIIVEDVTFGNGTGYLTLHQRWDLYSNYSQYEGVYQVPIATITNVAGTWVIRQILRSDIFFPYGLPQKSFYIDTHVDDFYGTCGSPP